MPRFFNHDDRPIFQGLKGFFQHDCEPFDHVVGSGIVESKENYAWWLGAGESQDLTEIQVEREYDPSFGRGFEKDVAVGQPVQTFISKVPDIMPRMPQPLGDTRGNTHVSQESQ